MTIIVLTSCPPKLRGDLSKWMAEINTGVYVGRLSSKVRDELWKRICENIKSGQATMVFPAEGEQHMDFRVHNTTWEIADFDGIKLMRRPSAESAAQNDEPLLKKGFSNAAKFRLISNVQKAASGNKHPDSFTVIDIETTGLDTGRDHIIEIGAIKVSHGEKNDIFSKLISIPGVLPEPIVNLTGISDDMINQQGISLSEALTDLISFIGNDSIICHNAAFDINFLQSALRKLGMPLLKNKIIDTLPLARKRLDNVKSYKLEDIADYYDLNTQNHHRALSDCHLTLEIFLRLNQS